ncbi:hypothetical protein L873DRAFT_1574323, partial [Choiromyces venosus 120613-1]
GIDTIVEILLKWKEIDPNQLNKYSKILLWCASDNRHKEVVKLPLGQDEVNPN